MGEECEYLYLVESGVIKERFGDNRIYRKVKGDMINIANICHPSHCFLSTVEAISDCRLIKIRRCKFSLNKNIKKLVIIEDLFKRNSIFEQKCYELSYLYFIRYLEEINPKYKIIFENIDDSL